MTQTKTDSLRTRVSLLDRVKNLQDARSWEEFFRTYERLVRGLARKRGVSEDEAEEVAQEVFRRVAQTIHRFERAPRPGSFRNWLGRLTRWRTDDKLREKARQPFVALGSDDDRTSAAERVVSPESPEVEFEQETRRHLLDTLFRQLESQVPPKHLQIFQLLMVDDVPVSRVATMFNLSAANVYVIKHRVMQKLREEAQRLPVRWD